MKKIKARLKNYFARDQLTADGGTVWKTAAGAWRRKRIAKFGGASLMLVLTLFLAITSIGLPFPGKVNAARAEATQIFARDGTTLLYKLRGDRNRTPVQFEQMPQCIKDATVATEDKDFYKHSGLDPRGFARAVLVNLETQSTAQGGSTITQQLVKNALLTSEQTFTRKARELVLSMEIEQIYAKDDILRIYLNEIPYGNNAYGIQAAAQTYFGRDAKDLTLAQCATLAGMPRAPSYYSPYNNPDPSRLIERSKYVLDQTVATGKVPEAEAAAAKAEIDRGLEFAAAKGEDIKAPHFVFYVREQLEQKYGTKLTQEGGLKVITTLDPAKQEVAEDVIETAARTRFDNYRASNAALTSVDPKTGQLLAMVGSVDYFNTAGEGNVNVATAERQPGSSIKPLVYLAGFKEAVDPNTRTPFNPATLLWDVKTNFGGNYSPNNYDSKFRGPVSARESLQQSLNVPSVKMLDLVGVQDAIDFAHEMGITSLNKPADQYGDALVLGGGEVKLVDLTAAYGVMANGGTRIMPDQNEKGRRDSTTTILKVSDRRDKTLEEFQGNKKEQPVSNELAYQISDVLKDDEARAPQFGRNSALTLPGREAAAKTGTTDSFRDGWTVGYTPQLATGVWIGNNDNSPMNQVGGSVGAAPIWQEYMRRTLQDQPEQKFERPGGISEKQVARLTGLKPKNGSATKTEIFTDQQFAQLGESPIAGSACGGANVSSEGLHSERPNDPNWENPVQAYIRANGLKGITGGNSGEECGPEVSITSPGNGTRVSGNITIQARATSEQGIRSVEFSVDGESVGSDSDAPFTATYQVQGSSGSRTITAKATDNDGNSKSATATVTVGEEEQQTDEAASLSLSCAGRSCTAQASGDVSNVSLVNADTGETVSMSGSGSSFSANAPASWTSAYATGRDNDGNATRSNTVTLQAAPANQQGRGGGNNSAAIGQGPPRG